MQDILLTGLVASVLPLVLAGVAFGAVRNGVASNKERIELVEERIEKRLDRIDSKLDDLILGRGR